MTRHAAAIGGQDAKNPPPPRHTERDTVMEAKLSSWESYLALVLLCLLASASHLFMEICTVFKPGQSQALLARFRTWIDTYADQVIISGSLILGFWLLAHRQQPVPDPHLRHPQISMELS